MKTKLVTFFILLTAFMNIQVSYGDKIPLQGHWDDEDYRSITALSPTLSLEDNILSVQFVDALTDLTVTVINDSGMIVYESVISGDSGETFNIFLEGMPLGSYQICLDHKLGYLTGNFEK